MQPSTSGVSVFLNIFLHIAAEFAVSLSSSSSRSSRVLIPQEGDPNAKFLCKGPLGEYAACVCNEEAREVACINAQFVDVGVFQYINSYYSNLHSLTFHGNNFQDLPNSQLFGDTPQLSLRVLNISANYIVNLNSNALRSVPNIQVLDLSNNEIVLTEKDIDFLTHTPKLTHLHMRRAFTSVVNRTAQFDLMLRMFANANLHHLKFLDLSYNYWTTVPYNLPCPFPSINMLDLRQNLLRTIEMNISCLTNSISTIDLSRNPFHHLDERFRHNFANQLPPGTLLLRNSFYCDCKSEVYIKWIRSTNVVADKDVLACAKASPRDFIGARLVEIPLHKLDCSIDLESSTSSSIRFFTGITSILFPLVFILIV